MQQAQSAVKPENILPLLCTATDHGVLQGSQYREHDVHPSFALERMVLSGKPHVEPSRNANGVDAICAVESTVTMRPKVVAADLVNNSLVDYRLASDEQLLAAARSLDGQAFVELSSRYADSVHTRVFRILRNREDTEDVVQEALVKAYTHLGEFRGSCAFSTWLTRIAINSALMVLRKRRSHSEVSLDQRGDEDQTWEVWEFPDPHPNAEQVYARRQTIDLLSRVVKRLPLRHRGILEQYHGREQSMQEAADTLGITVAAAKSRLLRARLTIRSTLVRKRISMANACY